MYQIKINLRCREREINRELSLPFSREEFAAAAQVIRKPDGRRIMYGKTTYVRGRRSAGVSRARQALRICKCVAAIARPFSTLLITGGN